MYLFSRRLTLARFPSMTETCHRFFHLNTTELERLNFFYFLLNFLLWLKLLEQCSFVCRKNPNPKQSLASNQNKGLHHRKQFGIALLSLLGAESASNAGRRKQPKRTLFHFCTWLFEKMARGFWTNNKEQRPLQTRENVNNQDALCLIFAPDCLRKWREVSITK